MPEAITVPSLMIMTLILSEESLARDRRTYTHTNRRARARAHTHTHTHTHYTTHTAGAETPRPNREVLE